METIYVPTCITIQFVKLKTDIDKCLFDSKEKLRMINAQHKYKAVNSIISHLTIHIQNLKTGKHTVKYNSISIQLS